MRHRSVMIATLVLSVALLLSGCEIISGFIDSVTGGGSSGTYSGARIAFSLKANVARNDAQAQATVLEQKTLIAAFQASVTYDAGTRTFTATWDGGDFSGTFMEIHLNATEETVQSFEVRQTRTHTLGAWTEMYQISGQDVLHFLNTAQSVQFLVDGATTSLIVDSIDYREWSKNVGSSSDPYYRLWPPQLENIWSDSSSFIEIELYR